MALSNNKKFIVYMHTSPSGKRYIGITSVKTYNRWGAKGQTLVCKKKGSI